VFGRALLLAGTQTRPELQRPGSKNLAAKTWQQKPGSKNLAAKTWQQKPGSKKGRPGFERPKSREETPIVGNATAKACQSQPQHEDALLRGLSQSLKILA